MAAAKNQAGPLSKEEFSKILHDEFSGVLKNVRAVAVGVSGGPDSMALAWLLSSWAKKNSGPEIHILIVDHGLRPESAREARQAGEWVKDWPHVKHKILRWEKAQKPLTRIQEEARVARYELMGRYCARMDIRHLFLAHHRDDQAETFLFRLAKGSGLDGLAAMRPVQSYGAHLSFLRPFLNVSKARLLATCKKNGLSYVSDPSNESESYARVRLRKSRALLEKEGLSAERLAITARRLARAREALNLYAREAYDLALFNINTDRIVFKYDVFAKLPEEIGFRLLLKAVKTLKPDSGYAPRMEKLENLFSDLRNGSSPFRKRTLGGIVFERADKKNHIKLSREI